MGKANSGKQTLGEALSGGAICIPSCPGVDSRQGEGRATLAFSFPLCASCTVPCTVRWYVSQRPPGAWSRPGQEVAVAREHPRFPKSLESFSAHFAKLGLRWIPFQVFPSLLISFSENQAYLLFLWLFSKTLNVFGLFS